jgi:hypothetical protein
MSLESNKSQMETDRETERGATGIEYLIEEYSNVDYSWNVSFTHFVPLRFAPTKELLEKLVSRCAAAIMPSSHTGVEIVTPIWTQEQGVVSYISVQGKNLVHGDIDLSKG